MYTTMHKAYIHLTRFSAVTRMLEKLLEQDSPADGGGVLDVDTWKTISIREAFHRISFGLGVLIIGLIIGAFGLGYSAHDYFPSKIPPAQSAK
jgi:hypothetical protein